MAYYLNIYSFYILNFFIQWKIQNFLIYFFFEYFGISEIQV